MTPKFGGGAQKPAMPQKKQEKPTSPGPADQATGLKRKDAPGARLGSGRKDEGKPAFGDVPDEGLEEALVECDKILAENPQDKEAHVRKFKILRKMHDRPAMRGALQVAARELGDPYFGVKLAEVYEEEGSYTKALEWRRWVAQFEPNDSDTIRRLAATAVRAGDLATSESSYMHLIELRKEDESPLGGTFYEEMLGKGLEPQQRLYLQQMALRLLTKALEYQPDSSTLLESAARLGYRIRDMKLATYYYERAIATNPTHRNNRQWKLELLRAYGNAGEQRPWYELSQSFMAELKEYLEEFRGDSRAWTMLAQLQIQAGYFEDAIQTLKSAMVSDSKNAQALWELGRLYVRMGRSQEAVDYYEEIINDPNEKKSVRRAIERTLADLYFKLGRYSEALELYSRDPEANLRMIAPIYEALGQMPEAEDHYARSVKQAPRDARTHLGVAEYWVRRENWAKAAEAGKEGLRCTYATEEVHSSLGVALATAQMKQNQFQEALATIEEICQAYPDSIHQLFRKVKLLILLNRQDEALALAEEVKTSAQHQTGCAPASSSLWSLLGDCHTLLRDTEGAKVAYTNALKYDYMDSVAVRGLGLVAEKQGDLRQALEMYKRFVVLDPLNLATPTIKAQIQKLREKLGPEEPEPQPAAEAARQGPPMGGGPGPGPGFAPGTGGPGPGPGYGPPGYGAGPQPGFGPPGYPGPAPGQAQPPAQPQPQPQAQPQPQPQQDGWLGGSMDWFDQDNTR